MMENKKKRVLKELKSKTISLKKQHNAQQMP